MTDEQIVRALAEKVMGWEFVPHYATAAGEVVSGIWEMDNEDGTLRGPEYDNEFQPLTSDADACAVLDKMREVGWYEIAAMHEGQSGAYVRFFGAPHLTSSALVTLSEHFEPEPIGNFGAVRRRAICIAALKAVGAWGE